MAVKFINFGKNDFFNEKNHHDAIYKYMPSEYALESLDKKYLYFANPKKWDDPFEKRFIEAKYKTENGITKSFPLEGKVFCTCMTQTPISEAHWIVYGRRKDVVRITFSRENLYHILHDFSNRNHCDIYIGKVKYMTTPEIRNGKLSEVLSYGKCDFKDKKTQIKLLLLKRNAFEYENEIRIIIVYNKKIGKDEVLLDYKPEFSNELVKKITLAPKIDNGEKENLRKKFSKYHVEVSESYLYRPKSSNTIIKI